MLERDLSLRLPETKVEVLNFAITGYGPIQHAAIMEQYAEKYRPDIVITALFVNDFEDALPQNLKATMKGIGFNSPSPGSLTRDCDSSTWATT